jgi:hypothetical protein
MITFVRKLNPPYKRIHFMIEGIFLIIDGITNIISFGYLRTGLQIWWIDKRMKDFFNSSNEE